MAEGQDGDDPAWQGGSPSGQGWAILPPSPETASVVTRAFLNSSLLLWSVSYISCSFWEISARMIPQYCLLSPGAFISDRNVFLSQISFTSSSDWSSSGAGFSCCTGGGFLSHSCLFSVAKISWSLHFSFSKSPLRSSQVPRV